MSRIVEAGDLSARHLGHAIAVAGISGRLTRISAVLVGASRQITIALERDGYSTAITVSINAAVEVQS